MIIWRDVRSPEDLEVFLVCFNVLDQAEQKKIRDDMAKYLEDHALITETLLKPRQVEKERFSKSRGRRPRRSQEG